VTSNVGIGVVGTGFGARVVAPVFAATDGCEVVDVASPRDGDAVHALAARADVDLVSVHSPPFLHARDVRTALDAGKAVLCEKPFALGAAEAAALVADADRAGVVNLVNFEFRWEPSRVALRDALVAGAIGRAEHVAWAHLSAGSRVPLRPYGWLFDAARGGGWVGAWASHAVDTLRWLFGDEVRVDEALRRLDIPERPDADGTAHACTAEDGLTASLTVAGDVSVTIDSSFASTTPDVPRITVFGADGGIDCVGSDRVVLRRPDGTREDLITVTNGDTGRDRHHAAMQRWAEVVRDSVRAGAPLPGAATFADGLACDRVLDRLRAAPMQVRR
jgi:predicted dehydrogenase